MIRTERTSIVHEKADPIIFFFDYFQKRGKDNEIRSRSIGLLFDSQLIFRNDTPMGKKNIAIEQQQQQR